MHKLRTCFFNQISLFINAWPRTPKRPWTCHFNLVWRYHWFNRDASRISGKVVHMYKGVGFRFADFISLFFNVPWKYNKLVSLRPNYFILIRDLKTGVGVVRSEPPEPFLDPPLNSSQKMNETFLSWIWILSIQHTLSNKQEIQNLYTDIVKLFQCAYARSQVLGFMNISYFVRCIGTFSSIPSKTFLENNRPWTKLILRKSIDIIRKLDLNSFF